MSTNESDRQAIKCPDCGFEVLFQHVVSGFAVIQPHEWWCPTSHYWVGICPCRARQGETQGDIYRALGISYA